MKKIALFFALSLSVSALAQQYVAMTGTIEDTADQVWAGTYIQATIVSPGSPAHYATGGQPVGTFYLTADENGNITNGSSPDGAALPSNATTSIVPAGTCWKLTVYSLTSAPPYIFSCVPVSGASLDLGSILSANLAPPQIQADSLVYAYNAGEIFNAYRGSGYINTISNTNWLYNGTDYIQVGGSSGGVTSVEASNASLIVSPSTGNVLVGVNENYSNAWNIGQTILGSNALFFDTYLGDYSIAAGGGEMQIDAPIISLNAPVGLQEGVDDGSGTPFTGVFFANGDALPSQATATQVASAAFSSIPPAGLYYITGTSTGTAMSFSTTSTPTICAGGSGLCVYNQSNPAPSMTQPTTTEAITTSSTSVTISNGADISSSGCWVINSGSGEFVCGNVSGNTITFTNRAFWGSTAQAAPSGSLVSQVISSESISANTLPSTYTLQNGVIIQGASSSSYPKTALYQSSSIIIYADGFESFGPVDFTGTNGININTGFPNQGLYPFMNVINNASSVGCNSSEFQYGAQSTGYILHVGASNNNCTMGANNIYPNAFYIQPQVASGPTPTGVPPFLFDPATNFTHMKNPAADSAQTTMNCSTSGTAIFTMPEVGSSEKDVEIYLNACVGTVSYTFLQAYTYTPQIISQSLASTVTSVSTTAVTITGATNTGFVKLDGF